MEWLEAEGESVDDAVQAALDELGLESVDQVEVEVLRDPKKGFLGLGSQMALVKVSRKASSRRRRRRRGGSGSRDDGDSKQQNSSRSSGSRSSGGRALAVATLAVATLAVAALTVAALAQAAVPDRRANLRSPAVVTVLADPSPAAGRQTTAVPSLPARDRLAPRAALNQARAVPANNKDLTKSARLRRQP